jgi:methionine sulfoxide reductase heme-binding subunit
MGLQYHAISWNRQKRIYDLAILAFIILYLVTFAVLSVVFYPEATAETTIIRSTSTLAVLMLHVILLIGPLARINPVFLPLLYNRRHLGVSMFAIASVHGVFSIIQFHSLGNINPIISLFTSNSNYGSLSEFPFEILGFFALVIFLFMAATSHDFWLKNLGTFFWKAMHMMVYIAYLLVMMHVMLGILQSETSAFYTLVMVTGMILVCGVHLTAAYKNRQAILSDQKEEGFVKACKVGDIKEDCARIFAADGHEIAIFKSKNKISAISNLCKHQNGPLGEGRIIDGCITCPWHGYQYLPHNGRSPEPFKEKIATFHVKVIADEVWVNPTPNPEGTACEPALI